MARGISLAWWRRRRDRRIAALGGRPLEALGPSFEPNVARFEPSVVDEEAARREIERLVEGLAPNAVDEAIGHPLDNLINSWTDKWVAEVDAEYAAYLARADYRVGEANATLAQLDILRAHDDRHLAEMELARDAATTWMLGEHPPSKRVTHRPEPDGENGADAASGDAGGHDGEPTGSGDPAKRRRFTPFGEPGYGDPTLMAGHPRSVYLHLVALILAAAADISAFFQVIQLVMPSQTQQIVGLLVVGFTAIVLYLAHSAGVLLRDRKAGMRWVRWIGASLCLAVWLALGLLAAWVRLVAAPDSGESPGFSVDPTDSMAADNSSTIAGAAVFLALYLGSGLAAALGAYLSHNRLRGAYSKAVRAHHKAAQRAAATAAAHASATANWQAQITERNGAVQIHAEARQRRFALAEELKQRARVLIAARSQDPALTDAILPQDHRPYVFPPQPGVRSNGQRTDPEHH